MSPVIKAGNFQSGYCVAPHCPSWPTLKTKKIFFRFFWANVSTVHFLKHGWFQFTLHIILVFWFPTNIVKIYIQIRIQLIYNKGITFCHSVRKLSSRIIQEKEDLSKNWAVPCCWNLTSGLKMFSWLISTLY